MVQHVKTLAPHLLWHVDRPNQCLGFETIAKPVLRVPNPHGVVTTIYKAHSLRGEVATFFWLSRVPKDWVQCGGIGVMCQP